MYNYSIPADFQLDGPQKIKELEEKYPENKVREVFGNISGSKWSSGHGYLTKQKFASNLNELEQYIKQLDRIGCDFNYTFNAEVLNNKDISKSGLDEIVLFFKQLVSIGVRRVTIASPFLMDYVSKELPELKITASSITNINSVYRAKYIDDYGVDTMVYGEDITRDFELIRSIKKNVRANTEIIVNSKCTFNCVHRVFHYASVNENTIIEDAVYNYGRYCAACREKDPVSYIKALWIRPEDIKVYAENGVDMFKLIGREQLSDIDLYRMMEVYFSQHFSGNLLDLIHGFSAAKQHYYIDNKQLDGFIMKFLNERYDCLLKCGSSECSYCDYYLKKSSGCIDN